MQKIILDTNVVVSSLIQRGYPHKIIFELFADDKFLLFVSEELMSEYYEVLSRPKFAKFPDFFVKLKAYLQILKQKPKR